MNIKIETKKGESVDVVLRKGERVNGKVNNVTFTNYEIPKDTKISAKEDGRVVF